MSRRKRRSAPAPVPSAPLILKLDPDAKVQVKLIETEKKLAPPNPKLRWFVAAVIIFIGALLFLWGRYIFPQIYSPSIDVSPLSIALAHPAYVAFGDEAELEATVTNRDTISITGTVTAVFAGSAKARPSPSETTTIRFDSLAGGASLTQRIKFSLIQTPTIFSRDSVRLALQVAVGDRRLRPITATQIAVAPLPYIKKMISGLIIIISSGLVAAIAPSLLDIFQKRFFSVEAK